MLVGANVLLSSSLLLLRPSPRCAAAVRCLASESSSGSVSGVVYAADEASAPTVRLFTKAGCTLCDVAKEVLARASEERPHTLEAVDITDDKNAEWFSKYKYDIPVLHIDGAYWAKHRITLDDTLQALAEAEASAFTPRRGEPDAARMERRRAES